MNSDISTDNIHELLQIFATSMYTAQDPSEVGSIDHAIIERCTAILNLDYNILEISNHRGELSYSYPSQLLIPENEISTASSSSQTIYEHPIDAARLRELFKNARAARCRARFPIPVILYRGKYICRSSTLSGFPEVCGRDSYKSFSNFGGNLFALGRAIATMDAEETDNGAMEAEENFNENNIDEMESNGKGILVADEIEIEERYSADETKEKRNPNKMDAVRADDIKLIRYLNVETIADLMVENKKIKYGLKVSSSEKVDKENRYASFRLASLPYPGCEFFKQYRDNSYSTSNLVYDWTQSHNDAKIRVPNITSTSSSTSSAVVATSSPSTSESTSSTSTSSSSSSSSPARSSGTASNCTQIPSTTTPKTFATTAKQSPLNINWDDYDKWDLQEITLNYLKIMLHYIQDSSSGLLVHCISGWDRTPLFISLLRISLWADGAIHQSLSAAQLLYFTIAYDWFLFGHNLPDRLLKGEDIFLFCFYMLKHLDGKEFCSVNLSSRQNRSKNNSSSSSIGVIRTDSDCALLDNNGMLFDGESNIGSNLSINSIGSTRSHQEIIDHNDAFDHHHFNGNGYRMHRDSNNSVGSCSLTDNANGSSIESIFAEIHISANIMETENANIVHGASSIGGVIDADSIDGEIFTDNNSANVRRTSPVSVPISAISQRQRNESLSSVGGSWQMVSNTGSYRSPEPPHLSQFSSKTFVNGDAMIDDDATSELIMQRHKKLEAIRMLFYQCYWATIGRSKTNGPIGAFLNNFVGRVGLASKTL